jgi:hypothetical protein
MTPPQLTDLIRLARVGCNALGQSANPQTMVQAWSIIGEAEQELAKMNEPIIASHKVND